DEAEAQAGTLIDLNNSAMAEAITRKDFVENATENLQTILHIPVLEGNEAIGTINLAKYHKEVIGDSDRNLLRQIANMLSINMTNQKLFTAAQNRAERERRVRAITDRIRRGNDRETILKIAREEIGQLLGAQKSMAHLGTQQQLLSKLRQQDEQD
ncbi:MAG: GAF domain-containing protein, partial [Anaerolineales bacterium]|nr:GAF domain-containing protein [Anaerolineales bacterium]